MGTFYSNQATSYQGMANEIIKDSTNKIVAKALVGSHFYVAYEGTTQTGETYTCICLFLLKRYKGEYGYKAIGEEQMPYYYTCPERILALSTQTCENSTLWRARCRETIRRKKEWSSFVSTLKKDQVIATQDGDKLVFLYTHNNKKIICKKVETGGVFAYDFKWFDY